MNIELVQDLVSRRICCGPLGGCDAIVDHPNPLRQRKSAIDVGFVIEHRFAFQIWIRCKQKLLKDGNRGGAQADVDFQPPDLVTWDWHDDCGVDDDCIIADLERLNQEDEAEVGLFCWTGLSSLNDGQILPAAWLNAIGNVYIVQKQRDDDECETESRDFEDRYGKTHEIRYFRSLHEFADKFAETNSGSGVIWDIDLDFFTEEEDVPDQQYTPPVSKRTIRSLLNPKKRWMQMILCELKAITIALEPAYTGGLSQSLELYQTWERSLFAAPVFSKECRWRDDLFE